MKLTKIASACTLTLAATLGLGSAPAQAQISGDVIKIGLITDMSSVYADIDGPAGVEAIRMAIADAGGNVNGKKIEVLFADHQNKADVAASKAREWFDTQGLDLLIGGTNSGAGLAMAKVAAEKKKPFIAIGAGSSALTNEQCSPYTIHWAYDTVALAKGTGGAVARAGGKSWYFLTADYAFGAALQNDTATVVKATGGTVALTTVAVWLARSSIRWRPATSRPSCCRRRAARRRSWAWPMPGATSSTRSRRPTSLASPSR